ncbi:hypothetical protein Dd703_2932 [Musicola paradisiaca Ech703]|uniref:Uncharacterized protein n=1 Tax=Musicola paradisiaca (strain Ech703) TaxID=579405 RepID=C6CBU7_MUSP7|nr:hypothetical protein Dd703_2932 [Musicola paradisiaca Ech703]
MKAANAPATCGMKYINHYEGINRFLFITTDPFWNNYAVF